MRAILLLVFAAFVFAGCLFQQPGQTATPTPTPTVKASPSPSPLPTATATATPTPTPSPAVQLTPECSISVNPNDAQGPFKAGVSARFLNVDPGNATIKCTAQDSGAVGERKEGGFFFRTCDYPSTLARKLETASATGGGVSCTTLVVVQVNPEYSKTWTFSPGDESFTMTKSVSNTTTRNYTITNTGTLELNIFSCNSDKSFVTVSCPTKIKAGETQPFNATFSVSGQPEGQQNVVLTVKEKDLEKSVTITLTITA
ncbi:MAG: hypothetical protein QXR53_04700 [Candidatus Norongarragalinales archaeon]